MIISPIDRPLWVAALPILAFTVLSGCEQEVAEKPEPVARPVKLLEIGTLAGGAAIEFPGSISATQDAEMAFEVSGQIIELPVFEGDEVEVGAKLAKLDDRDFAAARDSALAQRNANRADFSRYDEAFKADAVTAQDVDLARRNLDVAEARLKTAQKAVDDTVLRAPFAGRVAIKRVNEFETVQAKQSVLLLQDESGLEIEVDIPERDWVRAQPGLTNDEMTDLHRPRVVISSIPDRSFPARIISKANAADPVTRTYAVTLAFDKPDDLNIAPGMTGKVVVPARNDTEADAAIFIPISAVIADAENNPYVWVVSPGTNNVSRRTVQLGDVSGERIRVIGGIQDGDQIATSGVHTLVEGMLVRAL